MDTLSLYEMLLIIIISGAFGGLCYSLYELFENKNGMNLNIGKCELICRVLSRTLIGIAGAFGIVLIGFGFGKIVPEKSVMNEIFLISFSIIGGTISYRALPSINDKITKELQLQMSETNTKVSNVYKAVEDEKLYSSSIACATNALHTKTKADVDVAVGRLEEIKKNNPTDRSAHIYLGRLYRLCKKYDEAIIVLRKFIDNIEAEKSSGKLNPHYISDKADALYNIACYHVLKARKHSENKMNDQEERLIGEAVEALKESIRLLPTNKDAAIVDSDFDFIKDHDSFQSLIS